jgi:AbrB family looped-hinge helix DNA binding protein
MYHKVMMYDLLAFGGDAVAIAQKLSIIQKKGQVTIPAEIRNNLGLREGDVVAFTETDEGVLISPQAVIATQALDRIGEALQQAGVDLDDLIEEGRSARMQLLEEEYGINSVE